MGRGPSWRSGTGWGTLYRMVRTSRGTFLDVRDRLGDPPGGSERVGGPSQWSGVYLGTFLEVQDGSGDRLGGPGRVGRCSRRSGTDRGILKGIWDRWDALRKVRHEWVSLQEGLRRVGGPSWRSGSGLETILEVRDGSGNPWAGTGRVGEPWECPGRVGGPLGRSGTGRGTLGDVWNG